MQLFYEETYCHLGFSNTMHYVVSIAADLDIDPERSFKWSMLGYLIH